MTATCRGVWYNNTRTKVGYRMGEKEKNDLFYVCSLIEYVGRRTKNRRGDVVAALACVKFIKAEVLS